MLKENLTTSEIEKYAQDNGYDSVKFICRIKKDGETTLPITGQFLDAYYGFIEIPLFGEGTVRLKTLQDKFGDRNLYFDIPENDEEFNAARQVEFILRGGTPPEND